MTEANNASQTRPARQRKERAAQITIATYSRKKVPRIGPIVLTGTGLPPRYLMGTAMNSSRNDSASMVPIITSQRHIFFGLGLRFSVMGKSVSITVGDAIDEIGIGGF